MTETEAFLANAEALLANAKTAEKAAASLRREGNVEQAIEAYKNVRELYAETGLQYRNDDADGVMRAIKRCDTIISHLKHPKAQRPMAITPRPSCLACGKPLPRFKLDGETFDDGTPREWGAYGDNRFCGLTCGWRWACKHAPMPKGKRHGA